MRLSSHSEHLLQKGFSVQKGFVDGHYINTLFNAWTVQQEVR